MKLAVKVHDIVELVKRFESSPTAALCELKMHLQKGAKDVLERSLDAEITLLGQDREAKNKRNGYSVRTFDPLLHQNRIVGLTILLGH